MQKERSISRRTAPAAGLATLAAPERPSHMQDFLRCGRTDERPKCSEDEAFIEAVTYLMSVASYRRKREVRWDPNGEAIV